VYRIYCTYLRPDSSFNPRDSVVFTSIQFCIISTGAKSKSASITFPTLPAYLLSSHIIVSIMKWSQMPGWLAQTIPPTDPDSPTDMSDSLNGLWWVGVLCSLLACVGTTSGFMIQKWSHMKNEALPESERKPSYRRPLWWLSLFLMILLPSPLGKCPPPKLDALIFVYHPTPTPTPSSPFLSRLCFCYQISHLLLLHHSLC
jgi:hypothetical protein